MICCLPCVRPCLVCVPLIDVLALNGKFVYCLCCSSMYYMCCLSSRLLSVYSPSVCCMCAICTCATFCVPCVLTCVLCLQCITYFSYLPCISELPVWRPFVFCLCAVRTYVCWLCALLVMCYMCVFRPTAKVNMLKTSDEKCRTDWKTDKKYVKTDKLLSG